MRALIAARPLRRAGRCRGGRRLPRQPRRTADHRDGHSSSMAERTRRLQRHSFPRMRCADWADASVALRPNPRRPSVSPSLIRDKRGTPRHSSQSFRTHPRTRSETSRRFGADFVGDTLVVVAAIDDGCGSEASCAATKIAAPASAHTPSRRIGFGILSPVIELPPDLGFRSGNPLHHVPRSGH